jgi:hypothetical protein
LLRSAIEKIVIKPMPERGRYEAELHGDMAALLDFAAAESATGSGVGIKVVAAEGFEPPSKGL